MRGSARWTLVCAALAALLVVAFATQLGGTGRPAGGDGRPVVQSAPDAHGTEQALADVRRRADLAPCPAGSGGPGPTALRDVTVQCAADGVPVDVARALAGGPVVLNLWAYWCGPCAVELPAMAEYQRRAGAVVTVVTVHQDPNAGAGLQRLAELGVRLPTFQDGDRRIAAALHVPSVMPATVVLRADGTVAAILPRAFTDADEIAAAVGEAQRR